LPCSGLVPRPRYRSSGTGSSISGFPYRSPLFSTLHSNALDETAIPPVSASGNRLRLRTRTGYAKIGSDQCEVVLHSATCTYVVRPSRALEKARRVSD
jgi:hypothetical protein